MGLEKILMGVVASVFPAIAGMVIIFKQLKDNSKIKKIIFTIFLGLYCIISYFFVPNELRFVLYITIIALILKFILKYDDRKNIVYAFNTEIILAFSEILGTLLLVIVGVNSRDIVENLLFNSIANILIAIIAIVFINIPLISRYLDKFNKSFDKNKKLLNILFLVLIIIYLIVSKNGLELVLKSSYYVNILFIVGVVFILTIMTRNELKSEKLKEEYQQMLNYVSKYEKIITDQGKANHEFKNQLMFIRGYAQMNSPKLIEYIDSITEDTRKTQSSYMISQLNKFPDGGIKGLLYYKLATMAEENISYDLQVEPGVKIKLSKLSVIMYKNITKILGVLLDNAIDASKKSKLKKIIISVEKDNKNVIFNIQNSYKGKIELSKFGTGYTTKGSKHGYGLKLVKDILDESNQFDIEKNYDKEYFYTRLIVKINNKKRKSNK